MVISEKLLLHYLSWSLKSEAMKLVMNVWMCMLMYPVHVPSSPWYRLGLYHLHSALLAELLYSFRFARSATSCRSDFHLCKTTRVYYNVLLEFAPDQIEIYMSYIFKTTFHTPPPEPQELWPNLCFLTRTDPNTKSQRPNDRNDLMWIFPIIFALKYFSTSAL